MALSVPSIEHVFVLMLENRSFDHMLGFSEITGQDAVTGQGTVVDGLKVGENCNIDPATGKPVCATPPADFMLSPQNKDPGHEFNDVVEQLCGPGAAYTPGKYPPINNSAFVASYEATGSNAPSKVMNCFSPDQLPVLNALAREFAVCDHWFSSIPGPTWPNRFFVHAATSWGLDDSPPTLDQLTKEFVGYGRWQETIYYQLQQKGLGWMVYKSDFFPQIHAINGMIADELKQNFRDFGYFANDVRNNYSAEYTFIEPKWNAFVSYRGGNSQHPLGDIRAGELLIKNVYEAIRGSPIWESSALVITYDEHGGFYDHVAPPQTVAPDGTMGTVHDFDFTQLGVRVPTVVVSPLIPKGVIDHTAYDHTSILATVEDAFGLEPLTNRDAHAGDFNHLFSLPTPRDTPSQLQGQPPVEPSGPIDDTTPLDPAMRGFVQVVLLRDLSLARNAEQEAFGRVRQISSLGDARKYSQEVEQYLDE